jgi:cyanophycinase
MANKNSNAPVPNGILVIIGGHENKGEEEEKKVNKGNNESMEILKAFIELTNKKECVIEVITTASSEGEESFADYEKAFLDLGAKTVGHIHHDKREQALNQSFIDRIKKADGVYFSGGNQLKLTSIYGGSPLLLELKQRYINEKIVIGGTSAGAMAFSTPMIFAGSKDDQQITGEIKETTGLEFLKDVCIDTHFVDRGRFVRMAQVIACNPTCIGIGIEENTAIVLRNGLDAEVIGNGIVIIIEGSDIRDSNILDFGKNTAIYIDNLHVKLLAKSNQYKIPQNNPPHI